MEFSGELSIKLFGINFVFTSAIIVQWIIILILTIISIWLTRNLKQRPDKKQSVLEIVYETIDNLVKENMGAEFRNFVPFIGTMAIFILFMNSLGLFNIPDPTEEYSVALGMAAISFITVQVYAIYKIGISGYIKSLFHPFVFMLPMNIMEKIVLLVSLSLRLFANIAAGAVIMGMIYNGLKGITPFLQLAIPVPFHFYFDVFESVVQTIIFIMLTMVNIKLACEE
ncbi:F0F1 ATP synthase subunit A [Clostridium oryzae]|uniref:ATP synthase subunit a n=1 Tax=Clostridium oryzae TaxID=1450648 RepID=A0A1V4IU48_9CLOT|nr:F0F1 ATP synthase subunit A [Clostridium oryzae]OPJ63423.1 ATP synthase subunit a [Clostridium oryzae]